MEKAILEGYTIYISRQEAGLQGCGLKYLGVDGMSIIELPEEELIQFAEKYPTICEYLEGNTILQIYQTFAHSYEATLGIMTTTKIPGGKIDTLDLIEECGSLFLDDAILGIEEAISLAINKTSKIFERRYVLEKLYRPHNNDKFKSCNINAFYRR